MLRPDDTDAASEAAALVALLRLGSRPPSHYADLVEETGAASSVLAEEHGLLAAELAARASEDIARWEADGIRIRIVLDDEFPENLRAVHDRPPLIFVAGHLESRDAKAVAVIGSRQASTAGIRRSQALTEALIASGYTIVSGLAAGIDTAAHKTALDLGGRTIAVIGTGLRHAYPPRNAALQLRIATSGAVVSQFWPDTGPSRDTFPQRNAVMSGLALATVIVEASQRSGARIQARLALNHGRPVLLTGSLLDQPWAQELATRPGVHVISEPGEVVSTVERLSSTDLPVA